MKGAFHFGGKSKMGIYVKAKTQKPCFSLAVLARNTGSESRILGQNCEGAFFVPGAFKLGVKLTLRAGLVIAPSFAPDLKRAHEFVDHLFKSHYNESCAK